MTPGDIQVLEDTLLQLGFARDEVKRAVLALDPWTVLVAREMLEHTFAPEPPGWGRPPSPDHGRMEICTVRERRLLDAIRNASTPFRREHLGELLMETYLGGPQRTRGPGPTPGAPQLAPAEEASALPGDAGTDSGRPSWQRADHTFPEPEDRDPWGRAPADFAADVADDVATEAPGAGRELGVAGADREE